MSLAFDVFSRPSRLRALLNHFSRIEGPRDPRRVAHPLPEVLLLVVCGTMADCDDYESIAAWAETHLSFLRRYLPYDYGAPCGRWLTLLMNRINPALFSAAFTAWVRDTWPERPDLIAIDGKTSRRGHDRADDKAPLHLVSAFATTSRLVLGQEAVESKSNELSAIPVLLERLGEAGGLKGALVSIDAIATNATIAQAIKGEGADYPLAVKANQPTLRADTKSAFESADPAGLDQFVDDDKGHGRIERRVVSIIREVDWLDGDGGFRANCACRTRRRSSASARAPSFPTAVASRPAITSPPPSLTAQQAAEAVRGHWGIENRLHWVLDVTFADDQSRRRKGHGAKNMAVVRHFAINLVTSARSPTRRPP